MIHACCEHVPILTELQGTQPDKKILWNEKVHHHDHKVVQLDNPATRSTSSS
jgi:hypothetical protein